MAKRSYLLEVLFILLIIAVFLIPGLSLLYSIILAIVIILVYLLMWGSLRKTNKRKKIKGIDLEKIKNKNIKKVSDKKLKPKDEEEISKDYIASKDSQKYHKKDCRFAKNIKDSQKIEGSKEEMESKGYKACKVCIKD